MTDMPPLPEGFTLDQAGPADTPPLPEGFTLDGTSAPAVEADAGGGFVDSAVNVGKGAVERAGSLVGRGIGTGGAAISPLVFNAAESLYEAFGKEPPPGLMEGGKIIESLYRDLNKSGRNIDLGYEPGTTWEDFKQAPLKNFIPFAIEQGLVSAPDMAAAVINLPAYVTLRSGEIADDRAINKGMEGATVAELVEAMPAAAASAFLERLGARGMFGLDDAVGNLITKPLKAGAKEAATEAGQEAIEYTGETLGTDKPFDAKEMAERSAAGAVAGAGYGTGVRAVTATGEKVFGKDQTENQNEAGDEAITPPPQEAVERDLPAAPAGQPGAGSDAVSPPIASASPAATAEERALLNVSGYANDMIDAMPREEIDAELLKARQANIEASPEQIAAATEYEATQRQNAAPEANTGARETPAVVNTAADIEQAGQRVNTEPSEGQKDAGNYKKAHLKLGGMDITIENPKGSERSGISPDGEQWRTMMPATYGYVKRTKGADGDQVDVYIGDNPTSPYAFVVDQIDPATGKFDEHKAMLGFNTINDAARTYSAGFSDGSGQSRLGAMTPMTVEQFKTWLKDGDNTKPLQPMRQVPRTGRNIPTQPIEQKPVTGPNVPQAEPVAFENRLNPPKEVKPRQRINRYTEEGFPALKSGKVARPDSIATFLTRQGGLQDQTGELATMDAGSFRVAGVGPLVRRNGGLELDTAREAAEEAGYLQSGSTVRDLLDALDEDLRGNAVYSSEDQRQAAAYEAEQGQARSDEMETEAEAIYDDLMEMGYPGERGDDVMRDIAHRMLVEGEDVDLRTAISGAFNKQFLDSLEVTGYYDTLEETFDADREQEAATDTRGRAEESETPRTPREPGEGRGQESAPEGDGETRSMGSEGDADARPAASRDDDGGRTEEGEQERQPEEVGADNKPQLVIPGAEKISDKQLAERKAEGKKKSTVQQKEPGGLFSDAKDERDMFEAKPEEKSKGFDADAWNKERADRIEASKANGNQHLDQIEPAVETMRGLAVYNVHDPKEKGVVRTVANTGDVVIHWSDKYSADKNLAEEKKEGRKTVMESWLAPSDLKDYVVAKPEKKPASRPTASWVIRRKSDGEVQFETFDKKKVDALNTEKYEAIPAGEYLGDLNQQIKEDDAKKPGGPRQGEIGMKLATGEVVLTATGRKTSPFPKVSLGSDRKALNTVKRVHQWLMRNALDEAKARGDKFNSLQFEQNLRNPSPADLDSAELYLFDKESVQPIPRPFTKPMFAPARRTYPLAPKSEWYGDANYETTGGRLVYMTPQEFLDKVRPLKIEEVARDNIDDLKQHIESGRTLDPLAIYPDGKEDGRHRAHAAKELGITRLPVLVWDRPMFAPAKGRDHLFAVHNIKPQGVLNAEKLGALPYPSLAVTKVEQGFDDYGEISLIASPEMIDPRNDRSIYMGNADIYSPRYPQITYDIDEKAFNALNAKIVADIKKYGGEAYNGGLEISTLEDRGPAEAAYKPGMELAFLKKKRKAPKPVKKADGAPDWTANRRAISDAIDPMREEYNAWAAEQIAPMVKRERIFKGFTYSGNRRYVDHNLENVLKDMKSRMKEGETFFYGAGSVRSKHAKRYRSLAQVQKDRGNIAKSEAIKELKDSFNDRLMELAEAARPYYKFDTSNSFTYADDFGNMLMEWGHKGPRVMSEGFDGIPSDVMNDIRRFLNDLSAAPSEYFEAKYQRAVRLDEFAGAIVPKGTSKKVKAALKKAGLRVVEYDKSAPDARQSALEQFEEQFFAPSAFNRPASPDPKLATDIRDIVMRVGGIDPEMVERIEVPGGITRWGNDALTEAAGVYDPSTDAIRVSLSAGDRDTAYHEAFHRLQRLFLNPQEEAILSNATEQLRQIVSLGSDYANMAATMDQIELEAEAFAVWSRQMDQGNPNGIRLHIAIRRAWTRIRNMIERVRNLLNGRGYQSLEDVFGRAYSGEMADRAAQDFGEARIDPEMGDDSFYAIKAFHGSPHDFDRFDISKIGTGEGAQAYGHGLYFAENESVARGYRDAITDQAERQIGALVDELRFYSTTGDPITIRSIRDGLRKSQSPYLRDLAQDEESLGLIHRIIKGTNDDGSVTDGGLDAYRALENSMWKGQKGRMYEVNINANPDDFLDWDKPLKGQPAWDKIKYDWDENLGDPDIIMQRLGIDENTATGRQYLDSLAPQGRGTTFTGVTDKLREQGIPGIKYLDEGSRGFKVQGFYEGKAAGDPRIFQTKAEADRAAEQYRADGLEVRVNEDLTYNYVVFDDSLIDIERRYAIAKRLPAGTKPKDVPKALVTGRLKKSLLSGVRSFKNLEGGKDRQTMDDGETFSEIMHRKWVDYLHPVYMMQKKTGAKLSELTDIYLNARLAEDTALSAIQTMHDSYVTPMVEKLKAAGASLEDLHSYLYALHAPERNRVVGLRNPEDSDLYAAVSDPAIKGASGMSDNEARAIIADLKKNPEAFKAIRDAATDVHAMLKASLKKDKAAGLISAETYDLLTNQWKLYVPLKGKEGMDEEGNWRPRSTGFDVRGDEFKQALGRFSEADNIIANAIAQSEEQILRHEKNNVGKAALRFVNQFDPEGKSIAQVYWAGEDGLGDITKAEDVYQRVMGADGKVTLKKKPNPFSQKDDVLAAKVGGKTYYIRFKDAKVGLALRKMNTAQLAGIVKLIRKVSVWQSIINTRANPAFTPINIIRDVQTGAVHMLDEGYSAKDIAGVVGNVPKAWKAIWNLSRNKDADSEWDKWAKEYFDNGGKITFHGYTSMEENLKKLQADVNAQVNGQARAKAIAKGLWKFIEDLNDAGENGIRLASYVAARKKMGMTPKEAAFMARDLTVDFKKHGEWGPTANSFYVFFNAALQGNYNIARRMARSNKVKAAIGGFMFAGMMQHVWNSIFAGDDDDGENAYFSILRNEPYKVERQFVFFIPGTTDYVTFPLPYGFNAFYHLGVQGGAMAEGVRKAPEGLIDSVRVAFDAFNPIGSGSLVNMISPTIGDPIVELWGNKNFFGGPIYPEHVPFDAAPPPNSSKHWSSTNPYIVGFAEFLNDWTGGNSIEPGAIDWYPDAIEHVFGFFTGGLGRFGGNILETADRTVKGEFEPEKTPWLRSFYGQMDEDNQRTEYFRERELALEADGYLKDYGGGRESQDYKTFLKNRAVELESAPAFKAAEKQRRKLTKARRAIEDDDRLPAAEKKKALEDIEKAELEVMRAARQAFEQARRNNQ